MHYLGAAISLGQHEKGVSKTPDLVRKAKLFEALSKYNVTVIDEGNIDEDIILND